MPINVEVAKNANENNTAVLRRFTRKVQASGVLSRMRSERYQSRPFSKFTRKKRALKSINRRAEIQKLIKLGKMTERKKR
ncbi:MAG: 30S ribosomal protein S21 [bacterium]|nr:30S ribosomal protein S21 [bacterium]